MVGKFNILLLAWHYSPVCIILYFTPKISNNYNSLTYQLIRCIMLTFAGRAYPQGGLTTLDFQAYCPISGRNIQNGGIMAKKKKRPKGC